MKTRRLAEKRFHARDFAIATKRQKTLECRRRPTISTDISTPRFLPASACCCSQSAKGHTAICEDACRYVGLFRAAVVAVSCCRIGDGRRPKRRASTRGNARVVARRSNTRSRFFCRTGSRKPRAFPLGRQRDLVGVGFVEVEIAPLSRPEPSATTPNVGTIKSPFAPPTPARRRRRCRGTELSTRSWSAREVIERPAGFSCAGISTKPWSAASNACRSRSNRGR